MSTNFPSVVPMMLSLPEPSCWTKRTSPLGGEHFSLQWGPGSCFCQSALKEPRAAVSTLKNDSFLHFTSVDTRRRWCEHIVTIRSYERADCSERCSTISFDWDKPSRALRLTLDQYDSHVTQRQALIAPGLLRTEIEIAARQICSNRPQQADRTHQCPH